MSRFRVSAFSPFEKLPEIVTPLESVAMMRKMKLAPKCDGLGIG